MKYDDVIAGKLCIAKHPNGNWYRSSIKDKFFSDDTWNFKVFFLDYGDYCNVQLPNLRILPKQFNERLPFQAIACCLKGLESVSPTDWTEENTDYFLSLTRDEGNILHLLTVNSVLKESAKDQVTLGPRYLVDLAHRQESGTAILVDFVIWHKLGGEAPQLVKEEELVEKVNPLDHSFDEDECEVSSRWGLEDFQLDQNDPDTSAPLVDKVYPKKSSSSCFPMTKWAQSTKDVTITFLVGEVMHYKVELTDTHLFFESNHNGKKY